LKELLKERPNANISYKLGRSYLNYGDQRGRALPHLKNAVKDVKKIYDPFSSDFKSAPIEAYYYLANAFHLRTEIDSAEFYYKKFLDEASKKQYLKPMATRGIEMCATARKLIANPVDVVITPLGTPINSTFSDYTPLVAFDENTLYFTSRRVRPDQSNESSFESQTGLHFEDIYVSYKTQQGDWLEPELLNINIVDQHSSVVSVSVDRELLYLYRAFEGNGNLYQCKAISADEWSTPEMVGSDVNTEANEYYANIAPSGERLFFVSDRKGGYGGKDIWFVRKLPTGEWAEAINAGPAINTEYDEDVPYFHPDDRTMYFSSNGHASMGGYDIFYSQLNDEGVWSTPKNIGYPINTTDDDHSYIATPNEKKGYYASRTNSGTGNLDIYIVEYSPDEESLPILDLASFAVLKGWIFPAPGDSLPSDLKIFIVDEKTGESKGEAKPVKRNGSFVFIIPSGSTYNINFKIGTESIYSEKVEVPKDQTYQELNREIFLAPKGSSVAVIAALKDEALGDVLKWRIQLANSTDLIPLGSVVYYLDENQNIVDSVFVSKDGYFEYKPLMNENYALLPKLKNIDNSELDILLVNSTEDSPELSMTESNSIFYAVSDGSDSEEASQDDTSDSQNESSTLDEAKNELNTTKDGAAKNTEQKEEDEQLLIRFNFNVVSTIPQKEIEAIALELKKEYEESGKLQIELIGSASHLRTSRKGGNEELARLRLINGKAALTRELANLGLDINKISTIEEKSSVHVPIPEEFAGFTYKLPTYYQYFKVVLH